MGIPKFYGVWLLRKHYPLAILSSIPPEVRVSSLLIDTNAILHSAAQQAYAYGDAYSEAAYARVASQNEQERLESFFRVLSTHLTTIIARIAPEDTLVIAVDGVAPQAKIAHQRQRRYRSAKHAQRADPPPLFDSNVITPGTEFMRAVSKWLKDWLTTTILNLPPHVIYSSHLVPGEGEHKIFDLLNHGYVRGNNAHVIWGNDADLVILSMIAPRSRIYVCREDILQRRSEIINIDAVRVGIARDMGTSTGINDFALLISLVGNDFLPNNPAFNDFSVSIDRLIATYRTVGLALVENGRILWDNLVVLLRQLAPVEEELMAREAQRRHKYPSWMVETATEITSTVTPSTAAATAYEKETRFSFAKYRGAWYRNAIMAKGNAQAATILAGGDPFPVNIEAVSVMVAQYAAGLAWVVGYYFKGPGGVSLRWYYPRHYAPLISDLADGLQSYLARGLVVTGWEAQAGQKFLNPLEQLILVLPPYSFAHLPEVVRWDAMSSPIADLTPIDIEVDLNGQDKEDHGVALVPFADPNRAIVAVSEYAVIPPEIATLYATENSVPITRTQTAAPPIEPRSNRAIGPRISGGRGAERRERGTGRGRPPRGGERGRGRRRGPREGQGRGRGRERGRGRGRGTSAPARTSVSWANTPTSM